MALNTGNFTIATTGKVVMLRGKRAAGNLPSTGSWTLEPGKSYQFKLSELTGNPVLASELDALTKSGQVSVKDDAGNLVTGFVTPTSFGPFRAYSNSTRPATSVGFLSGEAVWNSDDNALNYADGSGGWRDGQGILT